MSDAQRKLRKRGLIFFGEEAVRRLLCLPPEYVLLRMDIDHVRNGLLFQIAGPDLLEVPPGTEPPIIPTYQEFQTKHVTIGDTVVEVIANVRIGVILPKPEEKEDVRTTEGQSPGEDDAAGSVASGGGAEE